MLLLFIVLFDVMEEEDEDVFLEEIFLCEEEL